MNRNTHLAMLWIGEPRTWRGHRASLGGTGLSMQRPKTVKSKRFVSNAEGRIGKIPTSTLVKLVDSILHGFSSHQTVVCSGLNLFLENFSFLQSTPKKNIYEQL
jgi:hypothetical protein